MMRFVAHFSLKAQRLHSSPGRPCALGRRPRAAAGFRRAWALAGLGATAAVLATGCTGPREEAERPRPEPRTLATINGQVVNSEDFERYLRFKQGGEDSTGSRRERVDELRDYIVDILLDQEAVRRGLRVSDQEVEAMARSWSPDEQQSKEYLIPHLRRYLSGQKLIQTQIAGQVKVGIDEVQEYFNQHWREFMAEDRLRVLEILVESEKQAQDIRAGLKSGDIRAFMDAAARSSLALSAGNQGEMGVFERGQLPKELERLVFSLKVGEISKPFASGHGYHLFMVAERVPRHQQRLYEVQKEIFERLVSEREREAVDAYLKQIVRDASIEIHDEQLRAKWGDSHVG